MSKINIEISDDDFEENTDFIKDVLNALENSNNGDVVSLRWDLIHKEKNDILQKICSTHSCLKTFHKKLKQYRYIDYPYKTKIGYYIRWVNLKNPDNIRLTHGGIICKIIFDSYEEESEATITVKNNCNKMFTLNSSQCIIFQKINPQEDIILQLSKYIGM
jgi:hypothetical protein